MPLIRNEILSIDRRFPYNDSITSFFNSHHVKENVGAYYFYPWPEGFEDTNRTCVQDLIDRNYNEEIVLWIPMDSFVDENAYNYYTTNKIREIVKLEEYCDSHLNQSFILLPNFYNLQNWINAKNLISVRNLINTKFSKRYKHNDQKRFGKKKWICLNRRPEPHRIGLMSLLLSYNLDRYGLLTASEFNLIEEDRELILEYFRFRYQQHHQVMSGFDRLLKNDFEVLSIDLFPNETLIDLNTGEVYGDIIDNYHQNLYNVYRTTAVELISCSTFFEPTPTFGEKEIQAVYGKNFPIFIGSKGTARMFKNDWGMDIFDDVVNHEYDEIDDPTKRLTCAIESNLHLLNDTIDLSRLWNEHQKRFESNCDRMNQLLYNQNIQRQFDYERIKNGLDYFHVSYT
jgi:hypothetical protein